MTAYSSFDADQAGKAKSAQAIQAIYAEAYRQPMPSGRPYTTNVDPSRCHLNETWQNPRWASDDSYVPDWRRAIDTLQAERLPHGKKPRKEATGQNAPVYVRSIVYQTSPEYFFPQLAGWTQEQIDHSKFSERGPLDMSRVEKWKEAVVAFAKKEFGDTLLSYELHLDETSPHIHVHVVPVTNDGRLSSKEMFENSSSFRQHNDKLGAALKHLGILPARNRQDGNTKHNGVDPLQWNQIQEEKRRRDLEEAKQLDTNTPAQHYEKIPKELFLPAAPPLPPKPGFFASDEAREEYDEAKAKYDLESDPEWRRQQQNQLILDRLNDDENVKEKLRKKLAESRKNEQKLTQEVAATKKQLQRIEAANLRAIPLSDVLERMYSDRYFIDPRDKSIIRFDERKLGITGQKFIDNHDSTFKGGGAIDFVCKVDGCDPKTAIAKLRDYFGTTEILQHIASVEPAIFAHAINKWQAPPEPEAPAPNDKRLGDVRRWMTGELCISSKTAKHLLDTGQVYADNRGNCVIPRPHGGAFCRGTVKLKDGRPNTYKSTLGSKKAGAAKLTGPDNKPNDTAILCEGVKDGLALLDMYPEATIYIVGGNLHADADICQRHVMLAFDADSVGQEHAKHYKALYPSAKPLPPPDDYKDWAEYHEKTRRAEMEQQQAITAPAPTVKPRI